MVDDLNEKPSQLKFIRPAEMLLFAKAICDPPLGQATTIPSGQQTIKFSVLVESSKSLPDQPWEVVLWHNAHENKEWRGLALFEVTAGEAGPLAVSSRGRAKANRRYFTIELPRPADAHHPWHFTFKYRTTSTDNWKWLNEQLKVTDGALYFQPQKPPGELRDYLKGISSDVSVHSISSESPTAQLWYLTASAKGSTGSDSGQTNTNLGLPRSYTRWFATVRTWTPWLAPRHGKEPFSPKEGVVLCSFLRWDGLHLVLLAVSGIDDVLTEIKPDGEGNVIAASKNDRENVGQVNVLAAVAPTFEAANAAVMYHARKIVRGDDYMGHEKVAGMIKMMEKDVKTEWMENWYDGLTYCTWNALGQDLHEDKIYEALNILKEKKINITNLIIDDNWQSLDPRTDGKGQNQLGMTRFEANEEGFPHGLKHTCLKIREEHPNIQHIAVWHAILGYWGGMSPNGQIAKDYKTKVVNVTGGGTQTVISEEDVDRFYDDFYTFLLSCGVDSVKTDAQFMLDEITDAPDRRSLIIATQDAWTIASLRHFSIRAISCMSQFPQNMFHSQLPLNKPRYMVRNSDDFFPDIPSSHPWHIFCNAHNSLFTSHLNILPDWDMFQTSHPYSSFHAAGRCLSGGPVYITDYPGEHNLDLIAQMTARKTGGKTIVLRPSTFGTSVGIYTAFDEERLLKVGTFAGGNGGTGIVGLFNVSERALSELVNINSFPGVKAGEEYIVRAHTSGEISSSMKLDSQTPVISLEVEVKGYEILSAYALRSFTLQGSTGLESSATKVAVIGLLGKMTGAAAVTRKETKIEDNGRLNIQVALKALGTLGIYISTLHERSVADNILILISGKVIPIQTVKISEEAPVLEIDVEKAWDEMGLEPGWNNEVNLSVLVR